MYNIVDGILIKFTNQVHKISNCFFYATFYNQIFQFHRNRQWFTVEKGFWRE